MKRRQFLFAGAATVCAGCSTVSSSADSTVSLPAEVSTQSWSQYRGGPRRRGQTTESLPASTDTTTPSIQSRTFPVVANERILVVSDGRIVEANTQNPSEQTEYEIDLYPTLPLAYGRSVLVVPTREQVVGFDVDKGEKSWEISAAGMYGPGKAPAVLDEFVVVQDGNRLRLVQLADGNVVWSREFDSRVEGFATTTRRLAVTHTREGATTIEVLDPETGETETTAGVPRSNLHPVIADDVYTVSKGGTVTARQAGEQKWQAMLDLVNPQMLTVGSDLCIVGPTANDLVVALDRSTGEVQWETTVSFAQSPVSHAEVVSVPGPNDGILMIDKDEGTADSIAGTKSASQLTPFDSGAAYVDSANEELVMLS